MPSLVDAVVVQQRRVQSVVDSGHHTTRAFAVACVDYRHTPASQCGLYIGEVEVNLPRSIYHVRDATCGIAEGVVCLLEGVIHRVVRIDLYEALVVDDKEGVHTLSHLLHPIESLQNLPLALEEKGDRYNADGQKACLHGDTTDDGSSPCTCTPPHPCGDEDHSGVALGKRLLDDLVALLGSCSGSFGFISCTQALCYAGADDDALGDGTLAESLSIGVTK